MLLTFFTDRLCSRESPPLLPFYNTSFSLFHLEDVSGETGAPVLPCKTGQFHSHFLPRSCSSPLFLVFVSLFFSFISFFFHVFCTLLFPSLPPFARSSFLHPVKPRGSGPKRPCCGRCLSASWKCSVATPTQRA